LTGGCRRGAGSPTLVGSAGGGTLRSLAMIVSWPVLMLCVPYTLCLLLFRIVRRVAEEFLLPKEAVNDRDEEESGDRGDQETADDGAAEGGVLARRLRRGRGTWGACR